MERGIGLPGYVDNGKGTPNVECDENVEDEGRQGGNRRQCLTRRWQDSSRKHPRIPKDKG